MVKIIDIVSYIALVVLFALGVAYCSKYDYSKQSLTSCMDNANKQLHECIEQYQDDRRPPEK